MTLLCYQFYVYFQYESETYFFMLRNISFQDSATEIIILVIALSLFMSSKYEIKMKHFLLLLCSSVEKLFPGLKTKKSVLSRTGVLNQWQM